MTVKETVAPRPHIFIKIWPIFYGFQAPERYFWCLTITKWHETFYLYLFFSNIIIFIPKMKWKHVLVANFMCTVIFKKIGRHLGGHLGFLGPHHDFSQSPSIFLHLRYVSNHLWKNFLWTSRAHEWPLRDWSNCIFLHFWRLLNTLFYCYLPMTRSVKTTDQQ